MAVFEDERLENLAWRHFKLALKGGARDLNPVLRDVCLELRVFEDPFKKRRRQESFACTVCGAFLFSCVEIAANLHIEIGCFSGRDLLPRPYLVGLPFRGNGWWRKSLLLCPAQLSRAGD